MFYLAVFITYVLLAAISWVVPVENPVRTEKPLPFWEKVLLKMAVLLCRIFCGKKKGMEQKWKLFLAVFLIGDVMALLLWIKGKEESRTIFLIGMFAAGSIWFLYDIDSRKKEEMRQKQMAAEYPTIVSKLTLYLGAGMNLKKAFEKTAGEGRETVNPVYREMQLTCGEMEDGIPEAESYVRFGKRIRIQRYIRLGTLLAQNLKKGNAVLLVQLKQEAFLAMKEQSAEVRKAGEEMGTKLLLPMMLLMSMTMVLIMVPAFLSF